MRKANAIRLTQGGENLNLDGTTDTIERKRLWKKVTRIDGSVYEKFVSLGKSIEVTINYITLDQYDEIKRFWINSEVVQIRTERNEFLLTKFIAETLELDEEEDMNGVRFYKGVIMLEEI